MKLRHSVYILAAMLLAACGGGGGGGDGDGSDDGGGGGQAPALESTLAVSGSNATAVAADGLDATSNGSASSAGAGLVTGVQVTPEAGSAVASSLPSVAFKLVAMAASRPAMAAGVKVGPETEACEMGGTITVSGNVSGGSSVVAGDSLRITASNCTLGVDYAVATLNGSLAIDVTAGRFDPASTSYPKAITMKLAPSNLSMDSKRGLKALLS